MAHQQPRKTWGEFPQTTQEEIIAESKLRDDDIAAGKSLFGKRGMDTTAKRLKKDLDDELTRPSAEGKIYGLLLATIESNAKLDRNLVIKSLKDNNIFKRLDQGIGFALAVECVRQNDAPVLGAVVGSIKKEQAFNPDLTTRKAASGMTLGHYAARCNHTSILKELQKINVTCLETENDDRENVAHTASRFGALNCLNHLVENQPHLFARPNKSGQTPLHLEGGRLIKTSITLEQAQEAEKAAACKQADARKVLVAASRKAPTDPIYSVSSDKVKTRPGPSMRM